MKGILTSKTDFNVFEYKKYSHSVAGNQSIPVNLRSEGGTRRGNMGHLTRIANMVVQNLEKGPVQAQISDLIKGNHITPEAWCRVMTCSAETSVLISPPCLSVTELPEDCRGRWESFVDETLRETNRRNTVELVSHLSVAFFFFPT